ncbi:hypothetical protein SDC9_183082 [bioreactor metagenome]|uniref:Uncharacterized protein n=1 Tax=bioreactor metagenome TaxID=1076179 RepID=A0A645HHJ3_9ZZZZ
MIFDLDRSSGRTSSSAWGGPDADERSKMYLELAVPRHRDAQGSNVIFVDGHAEMWLRNNIPANSSDAEKGYFWGD